MNDESICKVTSETPIRIGTVFSFNGARINNGKRINKFLVEVGYINTVTGIDSANDDNRMNSKYVIEHIRYMYKDDVLDTFSNSDDFLPRVYARRLNQDETYNPNEELITFYMAYGAPSFVSPYLMKIHKIMQRITTFVDSTENTTEDGVGI